jgi:hypothetical protein
MLTIILSACSIVLSVYVLATTCKRIAELRRMGAENAETLARLQPPTADEQRRRRELRDASTGWKLPPPRIRRIDQG